MPVTAESLFRDVFLPLYPEDAKSDLGRARSIDANPAKNPSILAHLDDAAARFAGIAPSALGVAEGKLALDFSDASVHRLSAALTPTTRDRLLASGAKGTPDNGLFNLVVHGAAYVGACVVKNHGGEWAVRRPLWESLVALRSRAGEAELAVFHWLLKSLADGAPATLGDRYRAHVEVPTARPEDLPVIAPPDRRLPRLAKPRYDAFYKYLRAHLPELRDVGEHFPSPERFAELGFKGLSFLLVGGGRMLVVHGASDEGLHAFWLTKEGFEKAAFWPCDAFPEPILRRRENGGEERLEVVLSDGGAMRSFELLWWGP
jgi:hypothetical protein